MEINIRFTDEFEVACDILYWKPEEVIQAFINRVSLAKYHCIEDVSRLDDATTFLLNMTQREDARLVPTKKVHEQYIVKLQETKDRYEKAPYEDRYVNLSRLFSQWRKDIIANMSEKDFVIDVKARKKQLGIT